MPILEKKIFHFLPRPVLASGYRRCPCPSVRLSIRHQVCPCNNSSPVQARITKFGPKMQNTLIKVPIVLRGNQPWPSRSNLRSKSKFTPFWDQRCKIHWLSSLLCWEATDLDLQGQIWLKKSNFLASPLLEIHNHHITTREPWVPRLLHRHWLFHGLYPLHVVIYLDCFTVLTVSQSQHVHWSSFQC